MTTTDVTALSAPPPRHRLAPGDRAPRADLIALDGARIAVPDPAALVHLQFRRFAGCPVCNLHLRQLAARVDELRAAGVQEVAVFHSEAATMRPFQGDLPFDVVADPTRALYRPPRRRSLDDRRAARTGSRPRRGPVTQTRFPRTSTIALARRAGPCHDSCSPEAPCSFAR